MQTPIPCNGVIHTFHIQTLLLIVRACISNEKVYCLKQIKTYFAFETYENDYSISLSVLKMFYSRFLKLPHTKNNSYEIVKLILN